MDRITINTALGTISGSSFAGLDTVTKPTLKGGKKNPMQGRVKKVMSNANVILFTNANSNGYQNMVMTRLLREDKDPFSFVLAPRSWGARVPNTPFVEHKDKTYLEVIFVKSGNVHYLLDDQPIDKSQIEGLEDREPNPESQGGIEEKVIIRTFDVDNITRIRINGTEWE